MICLVLEIAKNMIRWNLNTPSKCLFRRNFLTRKFPDIRYLQRPCMINRIWGLKQHKLQVNGHAWFTFHSLLRAVRNCMQKKRINSKWQYISPPGIEPVKPRFSSSHHLPRGYANSVHELSLALRMSKINTHGNIRLYQIDYC